MIWSQDKLCSTIIQLEHQFQEMTKQLQVSDLKEFYLLMNSNDLNQDAQVRGRNIEEGISAEGSQQLETTTESYISELQDKIQSQEKISNTIIELEHLLQETTKQLQQVSDLKFVIRAVIIIIV